MANPLPTQPSDGRQSIKEALRRDREDVLRTLGEHGRSLDEFLAPRLASAAVYVTVCWSVLAALLWGWSRDSLVLQVVAVVAFGWVAHAMLLVTHEASHRLLLPGRRVNEWLGNLLFALPAGQTVESYRVTHSAHHNYLHTDRDIAGYIARPGLPRSQVFRELVSLLCGRVVRDLLLRLFTGKRLDPNFDPGGQEAKVARVERERLVLLVLYHVPLVALAAWSGMFGAYVAWVIAVVCVTPFLDGIRTVLEHRRGGTRQEPFHTRSHHVNGGLSLLFAPFFQYHWEHHVVPAVPHCELGRLHRLLVSSGLPAVQPVPGGPIGALRIALQEED